MKNENGNIQTNAISDYAYQLKKISEILNIVLSNVETIIYKLQIKEIWTGNSADEYYEMFKKISKTFPIFINNIELFSQHIDDSSKLYEELNKKYETGGLK